MKYDIALNYSDGKMKVKVTQSCPTLCDPMETRGVSCLAPLSFGESPGKKTEMGCHALLQGNLPNPGIEPRSSTLQADSSAEPPGEPKNTGMGSLSLLQWIFLTQELNWGLLHCKWILYCLRHQGSPRMLECVAYPFSSRSS